MLQVCGHPEPQVIWYRQGKALIGGECCFMEQSGRGNFSLVVGGVTENDLGCYTCQATNQAGNRQVTVEILLEGLNTCSSDTSTDNTAAHGNSDVEGSPVLVLCGLRWTLVLRKFSWFFDTDVFPPTENCGQKYVIPSSMKTG